MSGAFTQPSPMTLSQFTDRYNALLAEQEAGICAFYVLVAEDSSVLGRFNLVDIEDHTAELGYRVSQHVAGRGVATATVREVCQLATAEGAGAFDEASARAHAEAEVARTTDVRCATTSIAFADHGPRWRERLGEIITPTLVLHGEDDPFFPIGNGEALAAEIPDARLVRLDRVGHRLPGPRRPSRRGRAIAHTTD